MNMNDGGKYSIPISPLAGLLVGILLLCSGTIYGAGDDFFLRQQIDIPGIIIGSQEADFNGDGRTDIVLLADEAPGRRTMRSYIQRESGRFPPSPGQTLEIPSSANMIQCLDLDGDGQDEIYLVAAQGMLQYIYDGGEFPDQGKQQAIVPTLFVAGIEGGLLSQDIFYMLSGRPVAFLPSGGGYSLWEYAQGRFNNIGLLPVPHLFTAADRPVKLFSGQSHNPQGYFQVNLPAIVIDDSNGDEIDDVYLIWPDRLIIVPQNDQAEFDSQDYADFHFQNQYQDNLCQANLVDFDRDGRLDIVCSRSAGGISGAQTDINFFHSTQIRRGDRTESYTVSLTDVCGNLIISDMNGDGSPELVIPAIELGIMSTIKKMITKKSDFHILIYPIDNLGRPAKEPEVRKKISCRLDFESADPTSHIRINWTGDYDGDGMSDLVVADGGGQLLFFQGEADNYLQSKAELVLDMIDPDEIRTVQLNGDGRTDLVIIHSPADNTTRVTLLVTNRIG
jgi:hypothetical protein